MQRTPQKPILYAFTKHSSVVIECNFRTIRSNNTVRLEKQKGGSRLNIKNIVVIGSLNANMTMAV